MTDEWFAPFIDYVLSAPCPTCKALAWQDCDAPKKRARDRNTHKFLAGAGVTRETDRLTLQHATRHDRGKRHYNRDVGKAPWLDERVLGRKYHSIDYGTSASAGSAVHRVTVSLGKAMSTYPDLCFYGLGSSSTHVPKSLRPPGWDPVAELRSEREQLCRAEPRIIQVRDWLTATLPATKTPAVSSYTLKHMAEDAIGEPVGSYVSNGELIAAALMAGYRIRRMDGPNPLIAVSRRDSAARRRDVT